MSIKYQVIIIGAGPSGISAGITLAKKGVKCCVVDKSTFPREKVCGGLLTEKTLDLIKELCNKPLDESLIKLNTTHVCIQDKGKDVANLVCGKEFVLTERTELDNWLVQQYLELGGELIQGVSIKEIQANKRRVVLSNGTILEYGYLIGADGFNGITKKYIGRETSSKALGVEVSIPTEELDIDPETIVLDVGRFKDGYAWCFPKGDLTTIGFAFTCRDAFDYITFMKKYLKVNYNYTKDVKIKGAYLPYSNGKGEGIHVNKEMNLMLVGDAAGFIDAITGEGIYFALLSGKLAAESVNKGWDNRSVLAKYYQATLPILDQVEKSWNIVHTFYKFRKICLKLAAKHTNALAYFCDNQVSTYNGNFDVIKILKDYVKEKKLK